MRPTTALNLAVDSVTLGLCDTRDYFANPLLIAQLNFKSTVIRSKKSC